MRRILLPFLRGLVASVVRSPNTASATFFDGHGSSELDGHLLERDRSLRVQPCLMV